MADSILFKEPSILICLGVALFFSVINRTVKGGASAAFTVICICLSSFAIIRSLLSGATLQELLVIVSVFFIVDLLSFAGKDKGDGE